MRKSSLLQTTHQLRLALINALNYGLLCILSCILHVSISYCSQPDYKVLEGRNCLFCVPIILHWAKYRESPQ